VFETSPEFPCFSYNKEAIIFILDKSRVDKFGEPPAELRSIKDRVVDVIPGRDDVSHVCALFIVTHRHSKQDPGVSSCE
jgi:hypothetical protein